jgi:hypothetical protein
MAAPVTLTQLIQEVRRRANLENQIGFITDQEITSYLNYGCSEVYDMLVAAKGQEWFVASYPFLSVLNQDTYALPANLYQLMTVDIELGNNIILSARPYMPSERNRFKWYPGWFYNMPVYYRLQGQFIKFIPAPSAAYQVQLNYYPTYIPLSNPSDTFDGINGWEEFGIWAAVAACKQKGDEDPSFAQGRCQELRAKIEAMGADHAAYDNERVHDITADYEPFSLW